MRMVIGEDWGQPYLATAAILRAVIGRTGAHATGAARSRLTTVLTVVPELAATLGAPRDVVAALEVPREGNRPSWTLRSAHVLFEFVDDALARAGVAMQFTLLRPPAPEPLDDEFVTVLARRANPARLQVQVLPSTASSAGTTTEPTAATAPSEPSDHVAASHRAMHFAWYTAARVCAERALAPGAASLPEEVVAELQRNRLFSLLLLGQLEGAETYANELLQHAGTAARAHASYALAILYTRLLPPARRDYAFARECIGQSLAFTRALPSSGVRATNIAFLGNTLALIELREGQMDAALARLNRAIVYLWREGPDRFAADSMILFYNRARLHRLAGRDHDASLDFSLVLAREPWNCEATFDRGLLHQRHGRHTLALRDFHRALMAGPPSVELLAARARTRAALQDHEGALADVAHALAIDPVSVDAHLLRVELLARSGAANEIAQALLEALAARDDDARLWCLQGVHALDARDDAAALAAFDRALQLDATLADAWANRATVHYRRRNDQRALEDLDAALALRDDPAIRRNRERVIARLGMARHGEQAAGADGSA